jgi:hypothetical protein
MELNFIEFKDDENFIYKQRKSNISLAGSVAVTKATEKSLLAISNKFGVVFLATQKGLFAINSSL